MQDRRARIRRGETGGVSRKNGNGGGRGRERRERERREWVFRFESNRGNPASLVSAGTTSLKRDAGVAIN